jgi:hypothetical protein
MPFQLGGKLCATAFVVTASLTQEIFPEFDVVTGNVRLTVGDSPDSNRLISTCVGFDSLVLNWHLHDIFPFVL